MDAARNGHLDVVKYLAGELGAAKKPRFARWSSRSMGATNKQCEEAKGRRQGIAKCNVAIEYWTDSDDNVLEFDDDDVELKLL